jgi:hypothetical protein
MTGGSFKSLGQETLSVNYYFQQDTIQINYGETFSNLLRFENKGVSSVTFIKLHATAGALLSLPDSVTVEAGKTRSFPVKYLSSAALVQKAVQEFSASYSIKGVQLRSRTAFQAIISTENRLALTAIDPVSYLNNATNRVSIRLRCANAGYMPVQLTLKINSYPVGLQVAVPAQQVINLAAMAQEIITIDCININAGKFASDYHISVEAVDLLGNSLGTSSIKVVSLSSNKVQNLTASSYSGLLTNTTALNYTSSNQGYSYYNVRANGNFQAPDSTGLSYNVNGNYYNQDQKLDLYDTWINYRHKNFALQLGNINDNLDFPIYGRGIKASSFLNKNSSVDVFGVQNSYTLLSDRGQLSGANILGSNYNYSNGLGNNSRLSVLYSQNPNTGIKTIFSNGFMRVRFSDTENLELRGGLSNEGFESSRNVGYASGINYYKRKESWQISLNNYYSSAYYSGMQRGVLFLDEHFSYYLNPKTTFLARYNYNKNSPAYQQNNTFLAGFGSKTVTYEAGVNFAYGKVNVSVKPYFLKQDISRPYILTGSGKDLNSSSYRTEIALSFSANGKQFMLLSDYGITNSASPINKRTTAGLKLNASMSNRFYNVSAMVQTAPYYLTDQLSLQGTNEKFRLYAIGPGVHLDGFKDRMNVSANYYLSYLSNNKDWNNSLNSNVSYRIKSSWEVTAQLSCNSNTYFTGNYSLQSQMGVVKHFARSTSPGNATLDLEFYGDDNANGVKDKNEEAVSGIIANLNSEGNTAGSSLATMSNKKGKVSYVNLKKEAYSLHITQSGSRHLSKPVDFLLGKNQKMQVPLVRSGWLKGRINALKQDYIAAQPILEGMRISAKNALNETFETYTNEDGEFQIPLPLNEYTITADIDLAKFSAVKTKKLVLISLINNADIQFDIKDITRKVDVKQF